MILVFFSMYTYFGPAVGIFVEINLPAACLPERKDRNVTYISDIHVPRPQRYVFKGLRFHFTENGMKVLRPHDSFQIVLPVHTETMKTTENAVNLLLRIFSVGHLGLF